MRARAAAARVEPLYSVSPLPPSHDPERARGGGQRQAAGPEWASAPCECGATAGERGGGRGAGAGGAAATAVRLPESGRRRARGGGRKESQAAEEALTRVAAGSAAGGRWRLSADPYMSAFPGCSFAHICL